MASTIICLLLALVESHQVQSLVSGLWLPWSGLFPCPAVIRYPPGPSYPVPLDLNRPIPSGFCSFHGKLQWEFLYVLLCPCGTCTILDHMPGTPGPVVTILLPYHWWAEHTEEVAAWPTFRCTVGHSFLHSWILSFKEDLSSCHFYDSLGQQGDRTGREETHTHVYLSSPFPVFLHLQTGNFQSGSGVGRR